MAVETNLDTDLFTQPRTLSWRRLNGVVTNFDPGTTVSDVYTALGLDFEVVTEKIYARIGNDDIEVPNRRAIVRVGDPAVYDDAGTLLTPSTSQVFGTTGPRYKPLQNREIAKLLDPLLEHWQLDAVAALNKGRDILTMFKIEPFEVNGDEHQEYFGVREGKTGMNALDFFLAPVRLRCTNQLISGMRSASFTAGIAHGEGVHGDAHFHINVFELLAKARERLHLSFAEMGKHRLTSEQIFALIEMIFPEPKMPGRVQVLQTLAEAASHEDGDLNDMIRERVDQAQLSRMAASQYDYENQMQRVPVLRQDMLNLIERYNDENTAYANTAWAVWQANTELMDWGGVERGDALARSSLLGDRANIKAKAFSVIQNAINPDWDRPSYTPGPSLRRGRTGTVRSIPVPETPEQIAEREERRAVARYEAAAKRHNAKVAAGEIPANVNEAGEIVPVTAQDLYDAAIAKAAARTKRLEESLARATQLSALAGKSVEERIALRKQAREQLQARQEAPVFDPTTVETDEDGNVLAPVTAGAE